MNTKTKHLSFTLYHMLACPYCVATRKAIDKLELDIELRDTSLNSDFRRELINGGGKHQVPCLKIENPDGEAEWLYESMDIVAYLKQHTASQTNAA